MDKGEEETTMKLARFMAQAGVASRRDCEAYIRAGKVTVNGTLQQDVATRVAADADEVVYSGKILKPVVRQYYLLHKPTGVTCSSRDRHAGKLVLELLQPRPAEHLFSVGRLDVNSEGLLIITNDGELANRLTHPSFGVPKTYIIEVRGEVSQTELQTLVKGIDDHGERLQAISAELVEQRHDAATLRIVVREGKKRELRRMMRYLNHETLRLLRVAFGPLELGEFKPGFWRELSAAEVRQLHDAPGGGS